MEVLSPRDSRFIMTICLLHHLLVVFVLAVSTVNNNLASSLSLTFNFTICIWKASMFLLNITLAREYVIIENCIRNVFFVTLKTENA